MIRHCEAGATVAAPPGEVFAFLDDPGHLVAHMAKRPWSMAGVRMDLVLDERRGREPGARMRLSGRMLDYARPERRIARLLGPSYARWCVERMVRDTVRHFAAAQGMTGVTIR